MCHDEHKLTMNIFPTAAVFGIYINTINSIESETNATLQYKLH